MGDSQEEPRSLRSRLGSSKLFVLMRSISSRLALSRMLLEFVFQQKSTMHRSEEERSPEASFLWRDTLIRSSLTDEASI